MQNTLYEGQHLIENKIDYHFSTPKRGDIIIINRVAAKGILNTFISNTKGVIDNILKKEDSDQSRLIKRVIGIPDDNIDIRDGKVYINDVYYDEPYVKGMTYTNGMKFPIKLYENQYFAMGDNRERSMDCRVLGPININQIEGKAIFRLWPLNKFGGL